MQRVRPSKAARVLCATLLLIGESRGDHGSSSERVPENEIREENARLRQELRVAQTLLAQSRLAGFPVAVQNNPAHRVPLLSSITAHADLPQRRAESPIHLALLLPLTGVWKGGSRIPGAAVLAINRVNADKNLLPGRRLKYRWADSGCSAKQGLKAMGELLRDATAISAVIGPGCSSACEVTSYLSAGQNLAQISWGCAFSFIFKTCTHGPVGSRRHVANAVSEGRAQSGARLWCTAHSMHP